MKRILLVFAGLVYLVLIVGNFVTQPALLIIPGTILSSLAIVLGIPWLIRKKFHPERFSLAAAAGITILLGATSFLFIKAVINPYFETYAAILLPGLNGVFLLLSMFILRQEREGHNHGAQAGHTSY